jgi:hypothetical protein
MPCCWLEKAQANAPVLTIVPPEYEAYVNQRMAVFSSEFPVELATPEDVADAILASVNDETGQLRRAFSCSSRFGPDQLGAVTAGC